jgi:biotin-dependent carboxylase-like uncharacterized protein
MIAVSMPGLFSTIQDAGRFGRQAFGMPTAGAMDRFAYHAANLLAGNEPGAAVIEMTLNGGEFTFAAGCFAAIAGADMQARLNGEQLANWSCFYIPAGGELRFSGAVNGCRTYLAIHGGVDVPVVLGSRSTYTRAGIGGMKGRALAAGDILPAGAAGRRIPRAASLPANLVPRYSQDISLRVLLGPQEDMFTPAGLATLFSAVYTISPEADRMGYRLEGPSIEHVGGADIVSDALCPGAIQVPGHGKPIIMLSDRATTGGYAKIGAVIGPDLTLLAQAKPGDRIAFERCDDEQAVSALRQERERCLAIEKYLAQEESASNFKLFINDRIYYVEVREEV